MRVRCGPCLLNVDKLAYTFTMCTVEREIENKKRNEDTPGASGLLANDQIYVFV